MNKSNLKRSLEAELLKIERQENKIYGVGETRYDLMIKDVLKYIENSISKEVIKDKIDDLKRYLYTSENAPQDFLQYRIKAKIAILEELLEEK